MSSPDPLILMKPSNRSFHLQNEYVFALMISLSESQNCKGNCSSGDLLVDFFPELKWNVESSGFSQNNKVRLILSWKCWNMFSWHSLNETGCFDLLLLLKHCVLVWPKAKHFIWGMIIASPYGLCTLPQTWIVGFASCISQEFQFHSQIVFAVELNPMKMLLG